MMLLLLLLLCEFTSIFTEKVNLEFSVVVWRHGDRTPLFNYPTNPNNGSWKLGRGQLTTIGMKQQQELGQFFRNRYTDFLSEYYFKNETLIISSETDRVIQSALANMAGLYPPRNWQIFDKSISWQPVPIHIPDAAAAYIDIPWEDCEAWLEEYNAIMGSRAYQEEVEANEDLMDFLTNKTGETISLQEVAYLTDVFKCEDAHNITHPDWFNQINFTRMVECAEFEMRSLFFTPKARTLMAGPLLFQIRNLLFNATQNLPEFPKFVAFSGHDTNIASLSMLLGVYNNILPPYASALLFEIYSDPNSTKFIKLSYRNDSNNDPYVLILPFCGSEELCPLDIFLEATHPLVESDFYKSCSILKTFHYLLYIYIGAVFLTITALVVISMTIIYIRTKNTHFQRLY